jgi:hypothetical protein
VIGALPIPDPRTWPDGIRVWFRDAVGECGPLDVFIFNHRRLAALYLQDAITAAALLDVDAAEWHTERGYPVFCFDPARIGEIQHRLGMCGYAVHIVGMGEQQTQQHPKRKRGSVVSIATAREMQRAQTV